MKLIVTVLGYVFAVLLPVLTLLSWEQMDEAMRLFISRGDPGLPYFSAATLNLLFAEKATLIAKIRAWIFSVVELLVLSRYMFYLGRLLTQFFAPAQPFIRVSIAIILALGTQGLLYRYYLGRIFWRLMGALLN